ncbi:hypothetical protein B0T22DRAFT_500903 [Podospora appendiculata]|uniref:Phytocyanin domain-containing protein n=1 Tax=Podospora appendiculata TaxID=314037 RepID=A0AAE0X1Y9_9PEZI|nr:hypothetical protein B0T22DRAFT_500903 [Podospora appendiculata]
MQFSTLALATLASMASAQSVVTHVVTVGWNASLTYKPDNLKVNPGEMVQFQFVAGAHTVTQSTFDAPCQPISQHSNITGFHSGAQNVSASAASGMIPTYTIMVNNTNPIWVYCATGKHCENGMAMAINEPATNKTLVSYKTAAKDATTVVPGGASTGTGSGTGTGTTSGTGGTTGTTTAPSATTTAGAGILSAPLTYMLLAAAAAAFLL